MTKPPFKARFGNHNRDFRDVVYRTATDLSKYVWELKDAGKAPKVEYEILKNVQGKVKHNYCGLCLAEKLLILDNFSDEDLVNEKTEFLKKCRHQNKFLIKSVKEQNVT